MSRVGIVLVYIFGSCAIACLLAYPIALVIDADFERIVSRTILVVIVLLFWPAYRVLNVKNLAYLGFPADNRCSVLFQAWLLGVAILLPLSAYYLFCGFRVWEPLAGNLSGPALTILLALFAGLLIGFIEETLFRGLLQTEFCRVFHPMLAIALVNFLYACVHFLEVTESSHAQALDWTSGFRLFFAAFAPLSQPLAIWDSWLALFTAGIFLSVVVHSTRNIYWCIGIHAGWVAHIKIVKAFTDRNSDAPCSVVAGDYDKFIGELSTVWIVLLLIGWATLRYRRANANK